MKAEGDEALYPGCVTSLASAALRLAARADLGLIFLERSWRRRSALAALPPTYAGMKAEGDEALYPGCVTSLASAALRLAARADLGLIFLERSWRRRSALAALPPTYAGMKAEGDEALYPGCVTSLASAALRLAARADLGLIFLERSWRRRSALAALPPTYAGMKAEGDGAPYPGCVTSLASAALRLAARAGLRPALAHPKQSGPLRPQRTALKFSHHEPM